MLTRVGNVLLIAAVLVAGGLLYLATITTNSNDVIVWVGFAAVAVSAFRKRMQMIRSAPDERDFYALKALHFEKLKGKRSHQFSMRLNDQWRLILEFKGKSPNKIVVIVEIADYH